MSVLSTSSIGSQVSSSATKLTVSGLVSGIDTDKVIQGLLSIEQAKIANIESKRGKLVAQQSAFKSIEARLLALQTQMTQLSRSQNGVFDARSATSSDDAALTAAATSSAVAGVYRLNINSLAKSSIVASQGYDSTSSALTHGTIQLTVGDATTSITVDSNNDTLQGLAQAINDSSAAVSASVVNDGGGEGKQAYRLLISSEATGIANRVVITNNLANSSGNAIKPRFDVGSIGAALATSSNTGTSAVQSNAGAGYTGTTNNDYKFTVLTGGIVGVDNNLQVAYTDATGANTGTLTVNAADLNNFLTVAQGVQVQFASGTLVAGDTFHVKAFVPTVQDAADASITLGSGSGALTVTSATNQIDSLVTGIALNLLHADPNKEITLTVANDTDRMKKAVQDFVGAYNDLMGFIDAQSSFDSKTGKAGVLLGNRQASTIQEQVRSSLTNVVAGANPRLNYLGALGISTKDNGQLSVDDTKLSEVLAGRRAGVTVSDVKALFALTGSSPNAGIQFVTGSTKTRASATPYTLNISQAAEKATLAATTALAATTVLNNTNNTIQFSVDGKSTGALTLATGSYTRASLAQVLQAAVNGATGLNGANVNVGLNGDLLSITSNRFGAASQVVAASGTALTALGYLANASAQGRDVVGSFTVNGNTEAALGSGTFLIGATANENTADLQLRIALTPAQVGAGFQTQINVSRGVASKLDQALNQLFDPVNGRIKTIDDGFDQGIQRLDDQKARQSEFILARTQSLQQQFATMEKVLSQLRSASGFVTQQAANLAPAR